MLVQRGCTRRCSPARSRTTRWRSATVRADGTLGVGEVTVSLVRDERGRPVSLHSQIQRHLRAAAAPSRRSTAAPATARPPPSSAGSRSSPPTSASSRSGSPRSSPSGSGRTAARSSRSTASSCTASRSTAPTSGRSQGERWTMRAALARRAGVRHRRPARRRGPGDEQRARRVGADCSRSGMRSTMGVSVEGRDGPAGMVAVFSRAQRSWTHEEVVVPARRRQRHGLGDRALDARGGRRPPRAARPADRAAEPRPVRRPARAHARPRAPRRPAARGADRRPRPVQADQRLARPPAPATSCCARSRRGSRPRCGRRTRSRASAATSSSCCATGSGARRRRSSSPSGSPCELDEPLEVGGAPVYISASFGVAYAGARQRRRGAAARRRRGAVPREGARPRALRAVRRADARAGDGAARDRDRAARRARHRPARPALPAGGRPRRAARRSRSRR